MLAIVGREESYHMALCVEALLAQLRTGSSGTTVGPDVSSLSHEQQPEEKGREKGH